MKNQQRAREACTAGLIRAVRKKNSSFLQVADVVAAALEEDEKREQPLIDLNQRNKVSRQWKL